VTAALARFGGDVRLAPSDLPKELRVAKCLQTWWVPDPQDSGGIGYDWMANCYSDIDDKSCYHVLYHMLYDYINAYILTTFHMLTITYCMLISLRRWRETEIR
jgi:hypothetical protein